MNRKPRLVYTNPEAPVRAVRFDDPIRAAVVRRREELGLTVGELAVRAGLPRNFIVRYEEGEWRIPQSILIRIADALEAPATQSQMAG